MSNQDLYTNLEQSRIVAPIMERLGVEADAWISQNIISENPHHKVISNGVEAAPLFRLDKILLALPDWCTERYGLQKIAKLHPEQEGKEFQWWSRVFEMQSKRGSEAIAAAVELLKLLEDEGLGRADEQGRRGE